MIFRVIGDNIFFRHARDSPSLHPPFTLCSGTFACISLMDQWRWPANADFCCIAFVNFKPGCEGAQFWDLGGPKREPSETMRPQCGEVRLFRPQRVFATTSRLSRGASPHLRSIKCPCSHRLFSLPYPRLPGLASSLGVPSLRHSPALAFVFTCFLSFWAFFITPLDVFSQWRSSTQQETSSSALVSRALKATKILSTERK